MFRHGSSRCMVKTFCAHCAGNHKTADCNASFDKCANCSRAHRAMSPDCLSRESYNKIRQRTQTNRISKNEQNYNVNTNYSGNLQNTLNQYEMPNSSNKKYSQHFNQNTNNTKSVFL